MPIMPCRLDFLHGTLAILNAQRAQWAPWPVVAVILCFADLSGPGVQKTKKDEEPPEEDSFVFDPVFMKKAGREQVLKFEGLGGLLYLVAAVLLFRLGFDLATLKCDFVNYEILKDFVQQRNLLPEVYLFSNLTTLVLGFFACQQFFQRRRLFIPVSIALFWCDPLGIFLYERLLRELTPQGGDPLALSVLQHEPLYAAAFALAYTVLVLTSKRVKQTFVTK